MSPCIADTFLALQPRCIKAGRAIAYTYGGYRLHECAYTDIIHDGLVRRDPWRTAHGTRLATRDRDAISTVSRDAGRGSVDVIYYRPGRSAGFLLSVAHSGRRHCHPVQDAHAGRPP